MCVCFEFMSMHNTCTGAYRDQKRAVEILTLEFWEVVSCSMGAGN